VKKFVGRNSELFFVFGVVLVALAAIIFYFFSNQGVQRPDGREASVQNVLPAQNEAITLRDGRILKLDDQIQMVAPTYNEVMQTLEGVITKTYAEQKRVLLWVPHGVVELTYQHVIEMKTEKLLNSRKQEGWSPFRDTVRGVITLNEQGEEIIHFLQNMTTPDWGGKYRALQFDNTNVYTNRKVYNVVIDPTAMPPYIKQFYDKYARDTIKNTTR